MSKKRNRNVRAQHSWFKDYSWLHYDVAKDAVFCFFCKECHEQKLFLAKPTNLLFISGNGFSDWQNANARFSEHDKSRSHREASEKFDISETKQDIRGLLSTDWQKKEEQNKQ